MQKRLSSTEKQEVCNLYLRGESTILLSGKYGVSPTAICGILKRRGIERRDASTAQRKCELSHDAFTELCPSGAYWLGFLAADGTFTSGRSGAPELAVVLAQIDKRHLESFRAFLGSTHALTYVPANPKHSWDGSSGAFRFAVRSVQLVADAKRYGIGVIGPERQPVGELALSRDFWRGVIDGDGWLGIVQQGRNKGSARLDLVGYAPLLEAFRTFLNLNIPGFSCAVRPHKKISCLSVGGRTAEEVVSLLYDGASIALERKLNAAINILNRGRDAILQKQCLSADSAPPETWQQGG